MKFIDFEKLAALFLKYWDKFLIDGVEYTLALAAITVAYALSPVDLVPDFIPVLGYLDDLLILPALAALTCKMIPAEVWDR